MSPSVRNLLLTNAASLAAALLLKWPLDWLLWPYWIQSVVIGWYARKRILGLDRFGTKGLTINNRPVRENERSKHRVAGFFAMHYGFFHLVYLVFLLVLFRVDGWFDWLVLAACGISFVISQRQTYAEQHAADLRGSPNLGALMFMPTCASCRCT